MAGAWTATVPKTIKVGYRDYYIVLLDHWESSDKNVFGRCNTNSGVIELDEHMGPTKAANTLLHELMHAAWRDWGLPAKPDEEQAVSMMTNGLTTIFRDNPDLSVWIQENLNA